MTYQADFDNYQNTIFKFKRKLRSAQKQGKLFPMIGDDEIAVSQSMADRIRRDATVPQSVKNMITRNHHGFVKYVWML